MALVGVLEIALGLLALCGILGGVMGAALMVLVVGLVLIGVLGVGLLTLCGILGMVLVVGLGLLTLKSWDVVCMTTRSAVSRVMGGTATSRSVF